MNENIERVKHISGFMKNICTILMIGLPISLIFIWLNFEGAKELGFFHRVSYPVMPPSNASLIGGFAVSSVFGAFVVLALYHLRQFFALSNVGDIFSQKGANSFHRFSKYMVIYTLLAIPTETLLGIIMTINNPVGERVMTMSFQTYDLTTIFLSFVLFAISWVVRESVEVARENAQFV